MSCKLFALLAAMARLHKRNIRILDKVPRKYAGREVHLDSEIDRDTSFEDKTLATTINIKKDAANQLLLSGGVC